MQKALIIGSGMVGSALDAQAGSYDYVSTVVSHAQLDVKDSQAVIRCITDHNPDVVFHAAALSKVNYCEEHPDEALAVNAKGTANVVAGAQVAGSKLVYFSTDYVFDGTKGEAYSEDDEPNPVNAYGKSKLAGEFFANDYESGHIIRTSGVFGPRTDNTAERNFIRAIYEKLVNSSDLVEVVADQYTAITYTSHLAMMCYRLLDEGMPRLVHLTGDGVESWFGWACRVAESTGTGTKRVQPVPSKSGDTGTRRPPYSVLKSEYGHAGQMVAEYGSISGIDEYVSRLASGMPE